MDLKKEPSDEKPMAEKPALSTLVLFLSYITDLVFAALVFIVFLLATWGLHYCGDALDKLSINFVLLRFFELTLIPCGTLLCAIFVLE